MDGAFGRASRKRTPFINITPLVDVTLLLLIFFMVTATFREMNALDIQLPHAAAGQTRPLSVCEIVISADGVIALNETIVSSTDLEALLREMAATSPDMEVAIRADARVPYGQIVSVLDMVRAMGIAQVALPVSPLR